MIVGGGQDCRDDVGLQGGHGGPGQRGDMRHRAALPIQPSREGFPTLSAVHMTTVGPSEPWGSPKLSVTLPAWVTPDLMTHRSLR